MTTLALFDVIRLLSAEDVEALAARLGTPPTRFDLVYACVADDGNRRVLHDHLYSECTTPSHTARAPAAPPAPVIAHKPIMPMPKCQRVIKRLLE